MPPEVKGAAVFGGAANEYRYRLSRVWDASLPTALFVMMNPSTADPLVDDRTVFRCRRFAVAWGYGRLLVGNTFAYRCTHQKRLLETPDPVGPLNNRHLLAMAEEASLIVFAYGTPHARLRKRGLQVAELFREHGHRLHVLALSQTGVPKHPLYLPGDLEPTPWEPDFADLWP